MQRLRQYLTAIIFFLLLFAFIISLVGQRLKFVLPFELPTGLDLLPYYGLLSFIRMLAAYILALIFSLSYGMVAALKPKADKIMLPILDILQSVPILGFFPAAIFFFINVFQGSRLGVEMASIFLIFTSQAWNMTFGVYEAITTLPKDLTECSQSFNLKGWQKFRRLLMPATTPKLIYNSILSWAGGWYFLIASEIIAVGPINFKLPGLGSFLFTTSMKGEISKTFAGLLFLIAIIVFMDIVIWRPLSVWSQKFKYEFAAATEPLPAQHSLLLRLFSRWHLFSGLQAVGNFIAAPFQLLAEFFLLRLRSLTQNKYIKIVGRLIRTALFLILLLMLSYGVYWALKNLLTVLSQPLPAEAKQIPLAVFYSGLRLAAAYLITLLWTVPVAIKIGHSQRAARLLTPLFEIVASIPATALFPLMVLYIVTYTGSLNLVAILLILTGMQWYLLFNLIAGTNAIPHDLKEAAKIYNIKGWMYWRRLVLPAIFPSLITGSVTAWGGGWNALIIAEYFSFAGKTFSTFGIGALLDKATYQEGNAQMILLSLLAMVFTIVFLNRLLWRRLYEAAQERFKIE